ncbi:MAG: GyrI-like domain-containing protein [Pseudobdellovibrio sp.]|nr:GyrI-like domain-containing protein [Pseudobdellovibrio sp.]
MVKHTLFAVTIGLVIFFLYLMQYTGAFKSVTVVQDQRGPYTLVFKDYTGPYHKIVSTIEEVEKWARENGLKCRLSFGEYLDNPATVEEGRLRAKGGCLIDPKDENEDKVFTGLKDKLPEGFKTEIYPETKAAVALFTGAPGIGPLKVYPKADEFIKEQNLSRKGSVLEIYEVLEKNSMQTVYIWPLN